MKKILGVFLALSLSILLSCGGDKSDEVFMDKQFTNTEFQTTIVIYDSVKDLNKAYKKANKFKDTTGVVIYGHTDVSGKRHKDGTLTDGVCKIHLVEAASSRDFEVWGHELAHCIYGEWHSRGTTLDKIK